MAKFFNTTGACRPHRHYMVNLESRLKQIKALIDRGQYFTINRARQYGKTTILQALSEYLKDEYTVISLDFQNMTSMDYENESAFVNGLAREVRDEFAYMTEIPSDSKPGLPNWQTICIPP